MTSAELIEPKREGYLKELVVKIDLSSENDLTIKNIIRILKLPQWNFMDDIANFIENKNQKMDATIIYNKNEHSIKVSKMSKGYNWEIKVYGEDLDKIRETIKVQDAKLRTEFTDQKMQIHNDTKKDLMIAFGTNPDDAIVGTLKAGATDNLPVEDAEFFNILEIKDQTMEKQERINYLLTGFGFGFIAGVFLTTLYLLQNMDEKTRNIIDAEIVEMSRLVMAKLDNLERAMNLRFENLKKVLGDYLELSSSLSIATVKANLKNV